MLKGLVVALVSAFMIVPCMGVTSAAEESQTTAEQGCCDKEKKCCDKNKKCETAGNCATGKSTACKCKDCKNEDCDVANCSCEGCDTSDCKSTTTAYASCEDEGCQSQAGGLANCMTGDCASGTCRSGVSCDALTICTEKGCSVCQEESALNLYSAPVLYAPPTPPSLTASYVKPQSVSLTGLELPYQPVAEKNDAKQIQYSINIFEDCGGCLGEYEALRNGAPMMFAESKTLLPAMRAMHKHQLIRQLSSPKVICTAGQTAELEISGESASDGLNEWEGLRLAVAAEEVEKGLMVELTMNAKEHKQRFEVRTALLVESGQTIVLNANAAPATRSEPKHDEPSVYIVVTPEIVE